MPNDPPDKTVSPDSPPREHEAPDPDLRLIWFSAAAVAALTLIGLAIVWGLMTGWAHERPWPSDAGGWIVSTNSQSLRRFPQPSLQINPPQDLRAWRQRQQADWERYAWADSTPGLVQIPVARAMQLVLERGLPKPTTTNLTPLPGSTLEVIRRKAEVRR